MIPDKKTIKSKNLILYAGTELHINGGLLTIFNLISNIKPALSSKIYQDQKYKKTCTNYH